MFLHFFWSFDLEFLIFAFDFYQCDELMSQLCDTLVNKSQRAYFGILNKTKHCDNLCFRQFACRLEGVMQEKRRKEDELTSDFIKLNTNDYQQENISLL
jgi:hypothetical protein